MSLFDVMLLAGSMLLVASEVRSYLRGKREGIASSDFSGSVSKASNPLFFWRIQRGRLFAALIILSAAIAYFSIELWNK